MEEIIEFYRSENQIMNDAIDRFVVEIHKKNKEKGYKSIMLTGCGTNNGTTTTAINLAVSLADAGWNTVLVDCDMRKGMSYKRLNEEMDKGLSDYLDGKISLDKVIRNTNYDKLKYIPSGVVEDSPIRLFCSGKMDEFVHILKEKYDYVIFDFPSINIVPEAEAMFDSVDGIVLVAALGEVTKRQLYSAKKKMEECKDKYYGLLINKVNMQEYAKYIKDFDYFGAGNLSKKFEKDMKRRQKNEEK